jgi:hypothetical protein
MGAEVLRMAREVVPSPEGATPPSVFDVPLGYDGPGATFARGSPADLTHDSMGGERPPRAGRPLGEGRPGAGEREPRPLLDAEP